MQFTALRVLLIPNSTINHATPDANDRGCVSISYNDVATESLMGHFYRVLLLSTFVVLNVLTLIVIAMLVPMYYPKLRVKASNEDFVACLYWATAFIAFVLNVNYIDFSFRFHIINNEPDITTCVIHLSRFPCTIPSNTSVYADEMLTLLAKVIIIPVATIIELFIAIFVVRHFITTRLQYGHVYVVRRIRYDHRYYCWKHYTLQSAHVFGLWNIFISIQLATMTVLPLCVLLLTHPQVTIILLIFLILLIIILILIISYLLYWFQEPTRRCRPKRCVKTLVYLILIIAILGLIILLVALYKVMLMVQAQVGIRGIDLSLLPSLPLSAVGWYLNWRKSQKKDLVAEETEESDSVNSIQVFHSTGTTDEDPLPP